MRNHWEVYWRCGYEVAGSHPVTVNGYARDEKRAQEEALVAASEAIGHLNAVGIEAEVRLWTEKWKTRQVEERDPRDTFHTIKIDRADRDIIQARYEDSKARVGMEATS